jgi:hypothetical protein
MADVGVGFVFASGKSLTSLSRLTRQEPTDPPTLSIERDLDRPAMAAYYADKLIYLLVK